MTITLHDIDQEVVSVLSQYSQCTFTRQEIDAMVVYTIHQNDVQLGRIKLSASTASLPGSWIRYLPAVHERWSESSHLDRRSAEQESPQLHTFRQLCTDIRRSVERKGWMAEELLRLAKVGMSSDEIPDELNVFAHAHKTVLDTTPELLTGWFQDEARRSPIVKCSFHIPIDGILGDPSWRIHWGMELTALRSGDADAAGFFDAIRFRLLELSTSPNRTKVTGECVTYPEVVDHFNELWNLMLHEFGAEETQLSEPYTHGPNDWHGGHPGLDHDELIYRLTKAQEAEEIRHSDSSRPWKQIARDIQWNKGTCEAGLALLRNARYRLRRLKPGDPLLEEVVEHRAKETKEA
jgi:hypothetical protein